MNLGEKIQQLRKAHHKTQDELAELVGVSRQALSKWENGTSNPDTDKIVLISNCFSVTTDYLLKDDWEEPSITIESEPLSRQTKSTKIPLILSTTIILIGFIIAIALANDGSIFLYWQMKNAALGIVTQIIGIGVYEAMYFSEKYKKEGQYLFWIINIWIVSMLPTILCTGLIAQFIPHSCDLFMIIKYTGIGYVLFNGTISTILIVLSKRNDI